ncbi:hypothetical protein OG871_12875 [Kitasatospora sp. NBC_00374]|uniref:hypothetical protein n=1 Tax=Kitasatospora sp. NBC_00374 TaxID=2975964 RepID=UPI0030E47FC5
MGAVRTGRLAMHEDIVARAGFLLRELRLTPEEAQQRLADWFPELEREERIRYVREARLSAGDAPGRRPGGT